MHLGVNNLKVVRHVAGMLSGRSPSRIFEICTDGDLLTLIGVIVRRKGLTRLPFLRLRIMLMMRWFALAKLVPLTK